MAFLRKLNKEDLRQFAITKRLQLEVYKDTNNCLIYVVNSCIYLLKEYEDLMLNLGFTSAAFICFEILHM